MIDEPAVVLAADDLAIPATPAAFELEGYVDFYGYHTLAGGWCLGGWVTRHDDLEYNLNHAELRFASDMLSGEVDSLTFKRDDITDRDAIGFLIFLPAPLATPGPLQALRLDVAGERYSIAPVSGADQALDRDLVDRIAFILAYTEPGPRRAVIDVRLRGRVEQQAHGYIEYYGYHDTAGGYFFSGWVSNGWAESEAPERLLISFQNGDVRAAASALLYTRAELPEGCTGVLFFVPGKPVALGTLDSVSLRFGNAFAELPPTSKVANLRETELIARLKPQLSQARPGLNKDRLTNILARRPYSGEDTLDALSPAIFGYIDQAFICGPTGLLLMGWLLTKKEQIREIRVRCGDQMAVLDMQSFLRIERHDVLQTFSKFGFDDANCGFITYVPLVAQPAKKFYIEAETQSFEVGYRGVAEPLSGGINAIKQLLGTVDIRFGDIAPAFDNVLGPAVEAMNKARLAVRTGRQMVEYGAMPSAPKYSVLVPLHGRLDFVEYQMALFSSRTGNAEVEYVYVLDDPPMRREARHLFACVYEKFRIPFRAIFLERNVGFAPANNVGMEHCHGAYLVYLNSDVFPDTPDWLERLSARLETDPALGVVGPLLLFEDGAVQHRGMYFKKLEEYGDWYFCQHFDKGLRYNGKKEMEYFICITGACMMLRRDLAARLGGFDEIYAIGDFEDSDLCMKMLELGLKCGIDNSVTLFHLERKSQISGALLWRANLTAYNAWQHQRRWSKLIERTQAQEFKAAP